MTSTDETTAPTAPPATRAPREDRAGLVWGAVLGAVMLVVALVVALGGGTVPAAGDARAVVSAGGMQTVAVTLAGMRITPSVIEVPSGTRLVLDVTNTDAMRHDLVLATGQQTPLLAAGGSAHLDVGPVTASVEGWCSVPGHRAAGMTLSIVVTGAAATTGATGHDMAAMATGTSATVAPAIDFQAAPGPDWRPYDPTLRPAPGATEHRLTIAVQDTVVEVAPGVRQTLWTYNGTAPGPTLHGHVGDVFTITFVNDADMGHGIDFHAGSLAPGVPMRTLDPGQSLTYQFVARYSGAWLYHCSTMPMSLHIANGMYGAVIIDPPNLPAVDTEVVLVQSELYLGPQDGTADEAKIAAQTPDALVFNGYVDQYDHAPIRVKAGDRLRVWVVDAGPQRGTAFHIVGAQFDTVFAEGAYRLKAGNAEQGASQVMDLAPAQGGFVELVLPEPARYPFTDHAVVDGERGAHGIFEAY
jgi:nitrite reductase (NO-forming)